MTERQQELSLYSILTVNEWAVLAGNAGRVAGSNVLPAVVDLCRLAASALVYRAGWCAFSTAWGPLA